ncbi:MAG: hypothetical protein LBI82_03705 [Dysgonamonadaceae bacterium]|jgi:hypothetical protein|nr:hypothetical protein [Dysgonamonadaceae bacterium]
MKNIIICLMALTASFNLMAQDIEAIVQAPVLATTGGISVSQIATFTPGDSIANDNPYALFLSGNLNFNLFGTVSVPLTFAYTNQQLAGSVSLPFNRFSIAPSYKWVKVYAGYASMQFSPYSLAGHELFGGGVELTPDNGFKISAIYGRLKRYTLFEEDGTDPSFRRMGGGFSVEYKKDRFDVGINIFKAQDLLSSEYLTHPDSVDIMPQDNLTGSVKVGFNITKELQLSTEYGISALNRNINSGGNATGNSFHLLETEGDLAVFRAMKTRLTYTQPIGSIGGTYERVDPNYTTLGAYYMTNDYENITANIATTVKKFNIALDGGYQRDNLENQKTNTASRIIYSANISSALTEKLNMAFSLSNVQSYVYINDVYSQVTQTNQFQNLDTLNVTQLNYTLSLNTSYLLQSTEEKRQSVNLNVMYQKSAEAQQYSRFSGNDIYNTAISYQYSLIPIKLNASTSVSHNYNKMPENGYTQAFTYNLSLQKVFFNELRSSLSATYSNMTNQDGKLSDVVNLRLSEGYVLAKKHNFNLSLTMLYSESNVKTRTQYAVNLSYAYNFGATLSRKDKKLKMDYSF